MSAKKPGVVGRRLKASAIAEWGAHAVRFPSGGEVHIEGICVGRGAYRTYRVSDDTPVTCARCLRIAPGWCEGADE